MFTDQIKDRTVKDIFGEMLGEANANKVLSQIQKEYDNGVRGDELRNFAEIAIRENLDVKSDSLKIVVAAIAIIVI
jgi:hypothetical protein